MRERPLPAVDGGAPSVRARGRRVRGAVWRGASLRAPVGEGRGHDAVVPLLRQAPIRLRGDDGGRRALGGAGVGYGVLDGRIGLDVGLDIGAPASASSILSKARIGGDHERVEGMTIPQAGEVAGLLTEGRLAHRRWRRGPAEYDIAR
jgi:hypothetical protein